MYGIIFLIQGYLQGRKSFPRSKTKWLPDISRSNMIFQQMKLGTNVIPHFYVILTGQFICCIICMIQGQKVKYQGQLSKITVFNKKS